MKKISRWIGLAAAAALLSACAHNIVVKQDGLSFQDRQDGIAMNAGLSLDEATRNYVYTERRLGETYSFNLGAALESGAQASLLKVFPNLKMSPDGSGVERLVKLKFGPATSFQLGATTLSKNHAAVELDCEVDDQQGRPLWNGQAMGSADESVGAMGAMPALFGFFGQGPLYKAYGRVFNDALVASLENLNSQLASARPAIAAQ